jgi:hypothetical protein
MDRIEAFDPTRLNDSLSCLRLFYWRHERKYVRKALQMPLAYGTAVHECLAELYRGKSAGQCLKAFEVIWQREVLPWLDEYSSEDPKRNLQGWIDQFQAYRQYYQKELFKVLQVEAPFLLMLKPDLALCGIIDLLIRYLNQIMALDHKTTSITYQSFFDGFNPNHQFTTYMLGGTELLGHPVTTMIANCIVSVTKLTQPEKMFIRYPTQRSLEQLAAFKEEIVAWWRIVQACRASGQWPRNPDRCQRWKGGCDYHPLCTDIQADYRRLVPSPRMYIEQQWNPLRNLAEKGLNVEGLE